MPGAFYQITDVAVDATNHFVFFGAEYADPGAIGVGQLPTAATTTPTLGDYVFVSLPTEPNGNSFNFPHDPHAVATTTIGSKSYALIFDYPLDYVAVIDLQAFFTAPRSTSDAHLISPTYNLLTNKVITYLPIPGGP